MCLGAAGIEFENKVFADFADFRAQRDTPAGAIAMPLGQVPVLTLPDGTIVCQSGAHMRYAGRKAGMYPRDDDVRALLIDEIVFTADELMAKCPQHADPEIKKTLREAFTKDVIPKFAKFLAAKLGDKDFFVGDLSIADLALFGSLQGISSGNWDHVPKDCISGPFPTLGAFEARVRAHPLVVKHGMLPNPAPLA